jgi:hypothetical protein
MTLRHNAAYILLITFLYFSLMSSTQALELEPRLWSHLPMGVNFIGGAYVYTDADIAFDPVLELEDVAMELHTLAAKYIRTFELFDHSARVDLTQSYQEAKWSGLVSGVPADVTEQGLSDSRVRFAMNLYGSPPLPAGKGFAKYRASRSSDTIIGIGLVTRLPTGEYKKDELLNLGGNRFVFRPQIGISHQIDNWDTEITGEVAIFTKNDNFSNGNKLEQDPLYLLHAHVMYTFRPGLWLGASLGYDYGGEKKINGVKKNDSKEHYGWGFSAAYPISRTLGVKLSYINIRDQKTTGINADTYLASLAYMW